jgi:transcriptional regulator with XRE-family HTH domain
VVPLEVLPEQEDIRRRLKAARALRDLTVADLAKLIPPEAKLSQKTLHKLEGGENQLTLPILRELAARLAVPIEWFTVPDLPRAVAPVAPDERLAALEAQMAQVWQAMQTGQGRGGIRSVPPST